MLVGDDGGRGGEGVRVVVAERYVYLLFIR